MKALARELRCFLALRGFGLTLELLVPDPERGYRDRGVRSNTSHQALLHYA